MCRVVTISASTDYRVEVSDGLLGLLGQRVADLVMGRTACIVTDNVVAALYLDAATLSLQDAGFTVFSFVFPQGEHSKNLRTYGELLELLAARGLSRSDVIVALGGGVVGDLAGFAAATYLRGVPYVQVPTTLLSMVDSSVGGKTAIDLKVGKNLAGAFYPPRYVLCDPSVLRTHPQKTTADGWAEIIKYAILESSELFHLLQNGDHLLSLPEVIERCVIIKQQYVAQDEFDVGTRQLLNLGHTIGHSIEACSGFSVSHGHAVAIGTAMVTRASAAFGFCTESTRRQVEELFVQYHLPIRTELTSGQLCDAALRDKKRNGDTITLIIPREIGRCQRHPIPINQLIHWLEAGA